MSRPRTKQFWHHVIPMAWVDETSNAVQLKWLFWEKFFYFFNLFSQSATLPVYLFVSLFVILHFLSYYFSTLNIFQGVCLNFARTLGRAVVVEWFKGNSDVTRAVYFWKAKLESVVFRGSKSFQQNQRRNFSLSKLDLRKKALKVKNLKKPLPR